MQKENEGMMKKENCECEDSMMIKKENPYPEDTKKEDSAYRKIERIFKQKSGEQKPNKRRKEDKKIVQNLLKETIDFENENFPEKWSKIIEKVEFKNCPWKAYTLKSHKGKFHIFKFLGFYFICNPFQPKEQLHWIKKCLDEYPQEPNITNLNSHYGAIKDIWKNSQKGDKKYIEFLNKLSWATLGYQYAWTERKYEREKYVPFPKDIGGLVTDIATTCGYDPYQPEAAIINFYSVTQCMGGHLDNAEYEMEKPIVSLSFGNSAIFLLGGEDRHSEPIPMLLRSGDFMIMGGRARYCFHGVPRIIEETIPDYLKPENVQEEDKPFCEYLATRRLNINTRQVYKMEEGK